MMLQLKNMIFKLGFHHMELSDNWFQFQTAQIFNPEIWELDVGQRKDQ